MFVLAETTKEVYLTDAAIPNSHNVHSTNIENLRKYTDMTEEFIRIWQLQLAYIIPLVLSTTCIIPNLSHEILILLNLRLALYIAMQTAVIINTCRIASKFLEQ